MDKPVRILRSDQPHLLVAALQRAGHSVPRPDRAESTIHFETLMRRLDGCDLDDPGRLLGVLSVTVFDLIALAEGKPCPGLAEVQEARARREPKP